MIRVSHALAGLSYRCDRAVQFEIFDSLRTPRLDQGAAMWTQAGLVVDAYLARSGDLPYSDGSKSWLEHRPPEVLRASGPTFVGAPVTLKHPPRLFEPKDWPKYARGVILTQPTFDELDGNLAMRAKLLFGAQDILDAINDGMREISIGFGVETEPAPQGSAARLIQARMVGHHAALVPRGRSGPKFRILMDGMGLAVPEVDMKQDDERNDAMGSPQDMVPVVSPTGEQTMVPTWIAGLIEKAQKVLEGQSAAPAQPTDPAAPPPGAPGEQPPAPGPAMPPAGPPEEPEQDAPPPQPSDEPAPTAAPAAPVPAAPAAQPPAPAGPPEKEEDRMPEQYDSIDRLKLGAIATKVGVEIPDEPDLLKVQRDIVRARLPKTPRLDSLEGDALWALVEAAAAVEVPEAKNDDRPTSGWTKPKEVRQDAVDEGDAKLIAYLDAQGY